MPPGTIEIMRICLVAAALLALGCSANTTPSDAGATAPDTNAPSTDAGSADTGVDGGRLTGECTFPNDWMGCAVACSASSDVRFAVTLHWNGADYPCASSPSGPYESWSICRCDASGFVECADAPSGLYALPRMRCEVIGGGDAGPDAALGDAG